MKKSHMVPLLIVIGLLVAALACDISLAGDGSKKSGEDTEALRLQLTLQALQMTQAVFSGQDQQQSSQQQQQQESSSGSQNSQATAEPTATEDNGIPCNSSKFVSETIPDFSNFSPGETFSKTWTLRNAGDCDWTENYKFVFEEGDQMNGESSILVNTVIEPGETVTFKVNLKAPNAAGDYVGVWRLKAADGEKLGKYWVKIKVGPPPAAFAVTSVLLTKDIVAKEVTAKITTNAGGTVTYKWDKGGTAVNGSVTFNDAGTKSVVLDVNGFAGNVNIYIDNPNHQTWGPIAYP